jgi:hypothetical protein
MKLQVYLDDGRVFEYECGDAAKVREHAHAIVTTGYRHCTKDTFEHYPAHRVLKVKAQGEIGTAFPDQVRGT